MGFLEKVVRQFTTRPQQEHNDPYLWSRRKRALILLIIIFSAASPGLSSNIYFPGLPAISSEFHVSDSLTTLTAAIYLLSVGISPVISAAISEYLQLRRIVLLLSMVLFTIVSIGLALMSHLAGLVILRWVQAVGTAANYALGPAIISDCYPVEQRGTAISIMFFGVYFGPFFGPLIGGLLVSTPSSWRATFWFSAAYGAAVCLVILLLLPETYRIDDSNVDDDDGEKATTPRRAAESIWTPIFMLRHPHILLSGIVLAIGFGTILSVEVILPELFAAHYGFNSWQTGLAYLRMGTGNILGALINSLVSDRLLLHARAQRGGSAMVEDRIGWHLWPCGFVMMPLGMLLFGFGCQRNWPFWIPLVGNGIQSTGAQMVLASVNAYIVDSAPGRHASASAGANLLCMSLTCVLMLIATPLVHAIDAGCTSLLFAVLILISMALLFFLKRYGPQLRQSSGFTDHGSQSTTA